MLWRSWVSSSAPNTPFLECALRSIMKRVSCASTAPAVIQSDRNLLTLAPDLLTAEALAISLSVSWAAPPFNTTEERATEFLSRSYQAARSSLTDSLGEKSLTANVQIASPTTQAHVTKWRVLL